MSCRKGKERDDRSETTKEAILNAAQHLFSLKGYEGVSVRDIASDAGVAFTLINYYFNSKEKLFYETCARYCQPIKDKRLELLAEADGDPSLSGYVDAYLKISLMMCRDDDLGGINFARLMYRLPLEKKDVSLKVRELYINPVSDLYYERINDMIPGETKTEADRLWVQHMISSVFYSLLKKYTGYDSHYDFIHDAEPQEILDRVCGMTKTMIDFSIRTEELEEVENV